MLAEQIAGRTATELAFPAAAGGVLRYRAARKSRFDAAAVEAGIADGFHPHELRHTAASLAISAGVTLDTYADLFPDDLDAVAIRLDQARSLAIVGTSVGTDAGTEASAGIAEVIDMGA
jgi:integrase